MRRHRGARDTDCRTVSPPGTTAGLETRIWEIRSSLSNLGQGPVGAPSKESLPLLSSPRLASPLSPLLCSPLVSPLLSSVRQIDRNALEKFRKREIRESLGGALSASVPSQTHLIKLQGGARDFSCRAQFSQKKTGGIFLSMSGAEGVTGTL